MLKRTNKLLWALIIVIPMLLAGCGGAPKVEWELSISGDVSNPVTYTFAELAKMEMVDLDDILMEKSRG